MKILWTMLAVSATAVLWAGGAKAQGAAPVNFGNTATRAVLIQTEDTICDNTNPPFGSTAPDSPACFVSANDPSADFSCQVAGTLACLANPTLTPDIFGILRTVDSNGNPLPAGVFELTVNKNIWVAGVRQTVANSGGTNTAVTNAVMRIDTNVPNTPGSVAPGAGPTYWTGTAKLGGLDLILQGNASPMSTLYYGDTAPPPGTPVPLEFNCAGHAALPFFDLGGGPIQSLFGPPFPGAGAGQLCDPTGYVTQAGLDITKSSVTGITSTLILVSQPPNPALPGAPPAWATLDWRLQEFTALYGPDTDGDTIPDIFDNCVTVPNLTQCDGDQDGYGNQCDADTNNDGNTSAADVGSFLAALSASPPGAIADINCDGNPSASDVGPFLSLLTAAAPPGPSGYACAGTIPCP